MSLSTTKKICSLLFFLCLLALSMQAQNSMSGGDADRMLDSARAEIGDDNLIAKKQAEQVLDWSVLRGDKDREAQARLILGRVGWLIREFRFGQQHLHEAIRLFRQLGDSTGVVSSLIELGTHMRVNQLFDSAFTYYARALEITQQHLPDNFEKLGHANMVLGNVYNNLEAYDKAIEHFDAAAAAFLQTGDSLRAMDPMGNKTYSLRKKGRYQEAIDILRAIETTRENPFSQSISWLQMAEVYHEMGDYAASLHYAQQLFSFDSTRNNEFGRLPYCHVLRANALAGLNRHEEAIKDFEASLSPRYGNSIALEYFADRIFQDYIDYLKKQKRYRRALEVSDQFFEKKQTDFERNLNGQLADARTKYETERITQKNRILDLENKASKRRNLIYLIGLVALGILALVIWRAYSQSRRQTQLLRETQSQLIQAEKMASLGLLTAGVAHEINNPIAFINGNATALKMDFEELKPKLAQLQEQELTEEIEEAIEGVLRGTDRIHHIVSSLRTFSHSADEGSKPEDLHQLLEVTLTILRQKLQGVEVEKKLGNIPLVPCQGGRISQVLLNVIDNALGAMPEGGKLSIATFQQDQQVAIEVTDTGTGMSQEVQSKIFDPFFTTKEVGKGTGLGLSISYGIVKDHGGKFEVESKEGQGTRFLILLPISPSLNSPPD